MEVSKSCSYASLYCPGVACGRRIASYQETVFGAVAKTARYIFRLVHVKAVKDKSGAANANDMTESPTSEASLQYVHIVGYLVRRSLKHQVIDRAKERILQRQAGVRSGISKIYVNSFTIFLEIFGRHIHRTLHSKKSYLRTMRENHCKAELGSHPNNVAPVLGPRVIRHKENAFKRREGHRSRTRIVVPFD